MNMRMLDRKKCGLAFVTFSTVKQAHRFVMITFVYLFVGYKHRVSCRVRSDFRTTYFVPDCRLETSTSKTFGIHEWTFTFAPSPKKYYLG
jgi:hypothetical protein